LAKALEHPIRIDILSILREGPSSAARIARRLENVSLNLVAHHMKVLKELGCIELVETVSKRGAREHLYRTVGPPILDAEEWSELTPKLRQSITVAILRMISNDLARSLGEGRFDEIPDSHLSRTPLKLDGEGWSEVTEVLARTLEDVLEVGARSSRRIKASDEAPIAAMVAIMQFPTVERGS
jgi:DNA-binding transcriptional ArsR family regulator